MALKITIGKSYRTREGYRAEIFTCKFHQREHWFGVVLLDNKWWSSSWKRDGNYYSDGEHDRDLIEEWIELIKFKTLVEWKKSNTLIFPCNSIDGSSKSFRDWPSLEGKKGHLTFEEIIE